MKKTRMISCTELNDLIATKYGAEKCIITKVHAESISVAELGPDSEIWVKVELGIADEPK